MWRSEPEIVHPVDADAIPGWDAAMLSTFHMDPRRGGGDRIETRRRSWNPGRTWGVRDGDRWVGTLHSLDRTITVPGAGTSTELVRVDAVTAVTVASTHRRRGLLTGMLGGTLREARERGDAVSILIAAEWPIYGRFGYAPTVFGSHYRFHIKRPGARVEGDLTRVRAVDREQFARIAPAAFEASRRRRCGQVDRADPWFARALGTDGWPGYEQLPHNWLVHEGPDGPDGLLTWTSDGAFGMVAPLATVTVDLLAAASDDAYRDLWAYLCGIDGADQVRLTDRPIDEPVRWLLGDARTLLPEEPRDTLWLRLLDVCAALAARRYRVGGELVLEVVDDARSARDGISVAGRYRLRADGEHVTCELTREAPDLTLEQRALASIYLGALTLAQRRLGGGIDEHTPGAAALVDAMFSTALPPWNATGF